MRARWEDDETGRGVGDAKRLVAGASDLLAAFQESLWVAEQPEDHLLPHVERWCQDDGRLALRTTSIDDQHTFVLDLEWRGELTGVGQVRAAVFSLIGSFAESVTYVRQRRMLSESDGSLEALRFEIGTGELAPDTRFHPHGHTVVINVTGAVAAGSQRGSGSLVR
ncbi:hypothetical protein AB0E69_20925 [Kribbella sp. NPDC026611]|uniref:hypothetical protein n=1 Tax=Kribbella sp. NPDC026611 TaxID=3154911 RepID=UPI00340BAC5A